MSNSNLTELVPVFQFDFEDNEYEETPINSNFYILQSSDIYDMKVGYEETVCTDAELTTPLTISAIEETIAKESANTAFQTFEESGFEDDDISRESLQNFPKSILNWNSDHIMKWILDLYDEADYRYEDLNLHLFKKRDGHFLMSLTEKEWENIDKKRSKWLYRKVQDLVRQLSTDLNNEVFFSKPSISLPEQEVIQTPPRRKRGRPPKENAKRRPEQKIGRVWEFLRNLLLDPQYCPSLIYWEDYRTKKFRLVDGSKVAKLWGKKKNNPNMTYEKFSRTIRHYYKDKVIISVPKEKLVYRFGECAKGIETDNPNFGITVNLR